MFFLSFFFFFNDTATTEIYTLSLHDALPISSCSSRCCAPPSPAPGPPPRACCATGATRCRTRVRSEEHTSELQSQSNLVCRLLLEKKKKKSNQRLNRKKQHSVERAGKDALTR